MGLSAEVFKSPVKPTSKVNFRDYPHRNYDSDNYDVVAWKRVPKDVLNTFYDSSQDSLLHDFDRYWDLHKWFEKLYLDNKGKECQSDFDITDYYLRSELICTLCGDLLDNCKCTEEDLDEYLEECNSVGNNSPLIFCGQSVEIDAEDIKHLALAMALDMLPRYDDDTAAERLWRTEINKDFFGKANQAIEDGFYLYYVGCY